MLSIDVYNGGNDLDVEVYSHGCCAWMECSLLAILLLESVLLAFENPK